MTVLISQTAVKPVIYTMGAANAVLLAACGYLAFAHPSIPEISALPSYVAEPALSSVDDSASTSSKSLPSQPGNATLLHPTQQNSSVPIAITRLIPVNETQGSPARVDFNSSSQGPSISNPIQSAQSNLYRETNSGHSADPRYSDGSLVTAMAVDQAPATVSVPLALTTPPEGATQRQATVLNRLQDDFDGTMNTQSANSNSPAYAQAWQKAQLQSDWNFRQQFGTQAFIAAQLAQTHQPATAATDTQ
jgi:hypothetical protein